MARKRQQYSSDMPNSGKQNNRNTGRRRPRPNRNRRPHSHGHMHIKPGYCAGVGDMNNCPETFCSEQAFHNCWADGSCCMQGEFSYADYLAYGASGVSILSEEMCRNYTIDNPWGGCYWVEASRPHFHRHRHGHPHGRHSGHFTPPINQCTDELIGPFGECVDDYGQYIPGCGTDEGSYYFMEGCGMSCTTHSECIQDPNCGNEECGMCMDGCCVNDCN